MGGEYFWPVSAMDEPIQTIEKRVRCFYQNLLADPNCRKNNDY